MTLKPEFNFKNNYQKNEEKYFLWKRNCCSVTCVYNYKFLVLRKFYVLRENF